MNSASTNSVLFISRTCRNAPNSASEVLHGRCCHLVLGLPSCLPLPGFPESSTSSCLFFSNNGNTIDQRAPKAANQCPVQQATPPMLVTPCWEGWPFVKGQACLVREYFFSGAHLAPVHVGWLASFFENQAHASTSFQPVFLMIRAPALPVTRPPKNDVQSNVTQRLETQFIPGNRYLALPLGLQTSAVFHAFLRSVQWRMTQLIGLALAGTATSFFIQREDL